MQGLERTASQPMQRLLVVLAGMCQLRHLHLSLFLSNPREVATQWDALAASTQLTHLHSMAWLGIQVFCALDPATPLDLLQALHLDSAHQWRDDYSCMDTHGLQHLMQCCPGLQQLQLGAAVDNDADLSPLLQLRHLTALGVCMDMSERTARRLAALTGLKSLTIPTPILLEEVLVHLAKLQNLNSLSLQVDKDRAANLLDISPELLQCLERGISLLTCLVRSLVLLPCFVLSAPYTRIVIEQLSDLLCMVYRHVHAPEQMQAAHGGKKERGCKLCGKGRASAVTTRTEWLLCPGRPVGASA
ncbi:hypothetical protein COO60DRAFT_1522041 [Scenedesmus sp. NREL 46B-D3]|nr:hypothetical protein COO60DRAFT_1522041 [Scenedesmus sp. NREL 46B-D3]